MNSNSIIKGWPIYAVLVLLIAILAWFLLNGLSNEKEQTGHTNHAETDLVPPKENIATETLVAKPGGQPKPDINTENTITNPKTAGISLETIIKYRTTWGPVGMDWYGKEAKNFSYRDLDGKIHKLNEHQGKNILLVFWATYCPACATEIPHLVELRNTISPENLEIIAISSESTEKIKTYAKKKGINYTVSSVQYELPAPYSYVQAIPMSFFIDKQGKFKLIAEGMMTMKESMSVLQAKPLWKYLN